MPLLAAVLFQKLIRCDTKKICKDHNLVIRDKAAAAVLAALMVVGMSSTAFAASASTYAVTSSTVDGDGVTKSVTYIHLEDGEEVEVGTTSVTLAAKNPQITNINLILPGQVINL